MLTDCSIDKFCIKMQCFLYGMKRLAVSRLFSCITRPDSKISAIARRGRRSDMARLILSAKECLRVTIRQEKMQKNRVPVRRRQLAPCKVATLPSLQPLRGTLLAFAPPTRPCQLKSRGSLNNSKPPLGASLISPTSWFHYFRDVVWNVTNINQV